MAVGVEHDADPRRALMVGVHGAVATGVNADGHREILGRQVTSAEDGAGWLAFFRDLTARGLRGVRPVTYDAHAGLTGREALARLLGQLWSTTTVRPRPDPSILVHEATELVSTR